MYSLNGIVFNGKPKASASQINTPTPADSVERDFFQDTLFAGFIPPRMAPASVAP
jgi:hypothetical protein